MCFMNASSKTYPKTFKHVYLFYTNRKENISFVDGLQLKKTSVPSAGEMHPVPTSHSFSSHPHMF